MVLVIKDKLDLLFYVLELAFELLVILVPLVIVPMFLILGWWHL